MPVPSEFDEKEENISRDMEETKEIRWNHTKESKHLLEKKSTRKRGLFMNHFSACEIETIQSEVFIHPHLVARKPLRRSKKVSD